MIYVNQLIDMALNDTKEAKVLIDIGFNKGYNFAKWASLWDKNMPEMSEGMWHQALVVQENRINKGYFCGHCGTV